MFVDILKDIELNTLNVVCDFCLNKAFKRKKDNHSN